MNKNNIKNYQIPVTWVSRSTLSVNAESLAEAIELAEDISGPLPEDAEYVAGSYEVDVAAAEQLNEKHVLHDDYDEIAEFEYVTNGYDVKKRIGVTERTENYIYGYDLDSPAGNSVNCYDMNRIVDGAEGIVWFIRKIAY